MKQYLTVGVIGAGAISDIYLKNMTEKFDQLHVKSVAARHIENAQKKADQYGLTACTVDELLADPEIDLVVVLTPARSHFDLIRRALLAGKHVYTEKVIAHEPEKGQILQALAEEKGLALAAAPDTFMGTGLQTARRAIDRGLIGDIHSFAISANRNNNILLSIFAFLREPGGGILFDYAVYYMTALVFLLGPAARVAGVVGFPYPKHVNIFPMSPDFGKEMDTPVESQVSAIIKLENGITGTMHIDADSNLMDEAYFAIYGTKGILYLTDPNTFGGTVRYLPDSPDPRQKAEPVELWSLTEYSENSRGIGPADLADAVLKGRPIRPSKEMANHVLDTLKGILDSGESGGFVDIPSTCVRPEPLPLYSIGARKLAHASFNMKNVGAMLSFYRDVLGMKPLFTLTMGDLAKLVPFDIPNKEDKWIDYMKLADGQFIELFYPNSRVTRDVADRWANYGYTKLNLEVKSIEAIRERLLLHGVELAEDVHPTLDGNREIKVFDPDGNEVQFTEYAKDGSGLLVLSEDASHESFSAVEYLTQVALQVKDDVNMEQFYCESLGFKKAGTLTYGQLAAAMARDPNADQQALMGLRMMADKPWIDYIEVAPHQYIELFHVAGQKKGEDLDLSDAYGYQHFCIEVEDIHAAWDAVTKNGLKPDTEIRLGPDGAYQFWLVDPDGNRLELMQYTEKALQLG